MTSTLDDPAEIAALATEFIQSLDNLPQEVGHKIKEIQHKDSKLHDMLPKLATRESHLRDLLSRSASGSAGGSSAGGAAGALSETERVRAEKLADKIKADYKRADEWSAGKEEAALALWRSVYAHQKRLCAELERISPALIAQVAAGMAPAPGTDVIAMSSTTPGVAPVLPALSGALSSALAADIAAAAANAARHPSPFAPPVAIRRDIAPAPVLSRNKGSSRALTPSTPGVAAAQAAPATTTGRKAGRPRREDNPERAQANAGAAAAAEEDEEKDENVYCTCQRVSFGEMIGCDSEQCPYEWFHLSCVGVSKPLPAVWVCETCKSRIERERGRDGDDQDARPEKSNKKRKHR